MSRNPLRSPCAEPLFADVAGDIGGQLRILPAQDREDGADALGVGEDAGAAPAALRLGHLWRRRLDPRAHARYGRADRARNRADRPPRTSPASRRAGARWTMSPAPIGTRASATSSRCAAIRPSRARRSRRTRTAIATPPSWSPGSSRSRPSRFRSPPIPKCHPGFARPAAADLENLKRKIDAGADRAITQFFFSPESFFRFRDEAAAAGIEAELVPGILPVSNVATTRRFAASCGASIPAWMDRLFEGLDDLPSARQLVAATVAAELCGQLYAGGVRQFHFYTLNRAELAYAICHLLGLRPREETSEHRRTAYKPPPPNASWSRTAPTGPRSRRAASRRPIIAATSTSPATRRAITTFST